jgi:hypothetical protein
MDPRDVVLGRVCVERGFLPATKLAECLSACRSGASLSQVLVRMRLVPEDELEALRAELARFLKRGSSPWSDLQEDLRLTESLQDAGELTKERLEEALAAESEPAAPRLREILLEKGFVTFAALEAALHASRVPPTPMTCRACKATSQVARYDPNRMYLCKACTGELVPTADLKPESSVRIAVEGLFGKYRPEEIVGQGAMGVVYKAWDEAHQRWVALKVIRDTGRLEETARFRREVEIARVLHHPNIVALYDVTHVGDRHLVAMQFIEGKSLAGQRFPPRRAAQIVATLSHAMQYAHSRNVIHRDIKPQNIMLDRNGTPYLMDFGLAKSTGTASSITAIGMAMGTPSYMAPEQALGKQGRIDRRSDVYSLGAVLYDLVTGHPPFRGANPMDTLTKVVNEPLTPPTQHAPDLPQVLEQIILKCMDKDRNQRFATAKHLADELERFMAAEETSNDRGR